MTETMTKEILLRGRDDFVVTNGDKVQKIKSYSTGINRLIP